MIGTFKKFSPLEPLGLLFLRAGAGIFLTFFHGWRKIGSLFAHLTSNEPWGFIDTVSSLGFPFPLFFATLAAVIEFVGGLFLASGFLTRFASFFIALTMCVAVYRHLISDMRFELAALFLLISFYFLVRGPGRYSLDRLLGKDL